MKTLRLLLLTIFIAQPFQVLGLNNQEILYKFKGVSIHLVQGDILDQSADIIVNPANPSLRHMGGLCDTIHTAAGPELEEECLEFPEIIQDSDIRCKTGNAVITNAFNINAKYIIHTVGPDCRQEINNKELLLKNSYKNSLILANQKNVKSLALPAISVGIFSYPIEEAAKIAVETILNEIGNFKSVTDIYIILFNNQIHFDTYKKILDYKSLHIITKIYKTLVSYI
ncbi:MAG: macro domain-containing protein [Candidatus Babeliales bacterium]|nr:macro domain-containing protein [Candidatus Babeliales bacterium]